jgi:hypothetical protein
LQREAIPRNTLKIIGLPRAKAPRNDDADHDLPWSAKAAGETTSAALALARAL